MVVGGFAKIARRYEEAGLLYSLSVDLTWRCDLCCHHCYLSNRTNRNQAAQLSGDLACELVSHARKLGAIKLLLTGGEPFLYASIWQVLSVARSNQYFTSVFTHAGNIDSAAARELRKLSVIDVGVSLYSQNPAVHETITGVQGSFTRTMDGISALLAAGVHVTIKTPVLSGYNDEGLVNFMDWVRNLGPTIRHSVTPDITARDDGTWGKHSRIPSIEGSTAVFRTMRSRDPLVASASKFEFESREQRLANFPCLAGVTMLHVRADGTVTPCMQIFSGLGNLNREGIEEIWHRQKLPSALHHSLRLRDLSDCASCQLLDRCNPCVGLGQQQRGVITDSPAAMCRSTVSRLLAEGVACELPAPLRRAQLAGDGACCSSSSDCSRNCTD